MDSVEMAKTIAMFVTELQEAPMRPQALHDREVGGRLGIPIEVSVDAKSVYAAVAAPEAKTPAEASLVALLLSLRE